MYIDSENLTNNCP